MWTNINQQNIQQKIYSLSRPEIFALPVINGHFE